ncbi:MAG TPA: 1-(5-phosphoribosyl)-5-[(5-phosphoribosylamino)methylideneamino]imidazole-4-carboxamide isomerase [Syntrophomonadaceae bacterium]|jgi:phosphoribosylformimino-5-aminoimidazole carboxamide ribotide isomerase|nr:1-(5-phosphoribosyl)-5-[(5-phosphoribosylamino)methylideneamino]imidazole-4-carboxamide isomerase [Syntrophomonadaceae bacterium]HRX20575.1 1-(5-phosphoribosyl)-5-[(5-phosphoribosylamino)methylideneamino]imidazole-4-carboxamide isomerase [Syntrophomonadaceae bacterium]
MIIYPAIDLKDGQCVRLIQGRAEDKTVYSDSPARTAAAFAKMGAGYLHVVDLDGAFSGSPRNDAAIAAIAEAVKIPFQVGGGLRSTEDVKRILKLGAARVIIGTKAVKNPDFLKELLDQFGAEKIVLGIDARNGMAAVEGWVETSAVSAVQLGIDMKKIGAELCVYTDISRDGLLSGPNFGAIKEMAEKTGLKIIASGGVSSLENITDLKALEPCGVAGAIIGKALYDGKIDLAAALAAAEN